MRTYTKLFTFPSPSILWILVLNLQAKRLYLIIKDENFVFILAFQTFKRFGEQFAFLMSPMPTLYAHFSFTYRTTCWCFIAHSQPGTQCHLSNPHLGFRSNQSFQLPVPLRFNLRLLSLRLQNDIPIYIIHLTIGWIVDSFCWHGQIGVRSASETRRSFTKSFVRFVKIAVTGNQSIAPTLIFLVHANMSAKQAEHGTHW